VMLGASLGSGETLFWPLLIAQNGWALYWAFWVGVLTQFFINTEIQRWTIATGESIFQAYDRIHSFWPWFFLVAGFAGVGAYNLHRMPGVDRVHTLSLSGGFFVAFLYGISTALYPASGGIGAPFTRIELAVATVVIAIATWSAILLEYRRQTGLAGGALLALVGVVGEGRDVVRCH